MREPAHDTWILIADGEKALFLRNEGDAEFPKFEVERIEEQENPSTREQGADRPGRFNDGPNAQRSAVQDTDWHVLEKERFAKDMADILYRMVHRGRFDRLILAASPRVLGELRQDLHQEVTDRVVGEIPKTLTNHPIDEIETRIKAELQKG